VQDGLHYDRAAAERLVAIYLTHDVAATRARVLEALAPRPGERLLDVGAGPGFLAAAAAAAVGPTGYVCGVDVSEPLLAYAREQTTLPWLEFRHGDAAALPFEDGAFDAVVSMQVLEYVPAVDAALAEIARVLRPGGRALVVDTDLDSLVWHAGDRARAERVLAAWAEHCPHPHLPRTLAGRLARARLEVAAIWAMPILNAAFYPDAFSNRIIDLITAFVAGRRGVSAEDAQAWADDLRSRGRAGDYFFSLNRYVFQARKR
jgi:ubiquinone/menaquinone biosynthesis C-methylase UbiE